jgi:hypothetical protein
VVHLTPNAAENLIRDPEDLLIACGNAELNAMQRYWDFKPLYELVDHLFKRPAVVFVGTLMIAE